jgi:hypothetical protein
MNSCWWSHDWSKWQQTVVEFANGITCDVQKRTCARCGYVERDTI